MYVGYATRLRQASPPLERLGKPPKRLFAGADCKNALGSKAKGIIRAVQDPSRELDHRATTAVWYILYNYYRPQVKNLSAVVYREQEPGVAITRIGRGSNARAVVEVGRYFIEHTTGPYFARRVLQVGHELKHLD